MKKRLFVLVLGIAAMSAQAITINVIEDDLDRLEFTVSWRDWVESPWFGYYTAANKGGIDVWGDHDFLYINSGGTTYYTDGLTRFGATFEPQIYISGGSGTLSSANFAGFAVLGPDFTPPWWYIPTVFEGVVDDPYAVHVVYDLSNAPFQPEPVPEDDSTLAFAGLALAGLSAASLKFRPRHLGAVQSKP